MQMQVQPRSENNAGQRFPFKFLQLITRILHRALLQIRRAFSFSLFHIPNNTCIHSAIIYNCRTPRPMLKAHFLHTFRHICTRGNELMGQFLLFRTSDVR